MTRSFTQSMCIAVHMRVLGVSAKAVALRIQHLLLYRGLSDLQAHLVLPRFPGLRRLALCMVEGRLASVLEGVCPWTPLCKPLL